MNGKCPKCAKIVTHLDADGVDIHSPSGTWKGATFHCPYCLAVLGAGIDPVILKETIVTELSDEIKKLQADLQRIASLLAQR